MAYLRSPFAVGVKEPLHGIALAEIKMAINTGWKVLISMTSWRIINFGLMDIFCRGICEICKQQTKSNNGCCYYIILLLILYYILSHIFHWHDPLNLKLNKASKCITTFI